MAYHQQRGGAQYAAAGRHAGPHGAHAPVTSPVDQWHPHAQQAADYDYAEEGVGVTHQYSAANSQYGGRAAANLRNSAGGDMADRSDADTNDFGCGHPGSGFGGGADDAFRGGSCTAVTPYGEPNEYKQNGAPPLPPVQVDAAPGAAPARPPPLPAASTTSGGCCGAPKAKQRKLRVVHVGDPERCAAYGYAENSIRSSRYTWYNFLPLNLFRQFHEFSNVYFFIVMCISLVPGVSPITPITAIAPLVFVLFVGALKDGYEDCVRHWSDRKNNSAPVTVLGPAGWERRESRDVRVGDLLMVSCSEERFAARKAAGAALGLALDRAPSTEPGVRIKRVQDGPFDTATGKSLIGRRVLKVGDTPVSSADHIAAAAAPLEEVVLTVAADDAPGAQGLKADVVVLATSDDNGYCHIETAQLDGETNRKPRRGLLAEVADAAAEAGGDVAALCAAQHDLGVAAACGRAFAGDAGRRWELHIEEPTDSLYNWSGKANLPGGAVTRAMRLDQTIWRGANVCATDWVVCVVVYTGMETRMGKNMDPSASRGSGLLSKLNWAVFGIFCFKNVIMLILCGLSIAFVNSNQGAWYLHKWVEVDAVETFFLNYLTWFILLSFMIPISLFVTMQFCLAIQKQLMTYDTRMQHWMRGAGEGGGYGWVSCNPRTSDLNEELAGVKYILSDKTGTLTENQMVYRCGAVMGTGGEWAVTEHGPCPAPDGFPTAAGDFSLASQLVRYWLSLALCNNVTPFGNGVYEGVSTDEVALVKAARERGCELLEKSSERVTVRMGGRDLEFDVRRVLHFTSTRKLMSVVIESPSDPGRLFLLCKGADNVVLHHSRTANPHGAGADWRDAAESRTAAYGEEGWRTLALGWRPVAADEFRAWDADFQQLLNEAAGAADQQEQERREDELKKRLERGMQFTGVCAYEDTLQPGVRDTITFFLDAGVSVWMLTGDKLETAVHIARNCGLARRAESAVVRLKWEGLIDTADQSPTLGPPPSTAADAPENRGMLYEMWQELEEKVLAGAHGEKSIALDGAALSGVLCRDSPRRGWAGRQPKKRRRAAEPVSPAPPPAPVCSPVAAASPRAGDAPPEPYRGDPGGLLRDRFIAIAPRLRSAVCCRLTPNQKAQIVEVFQETQPETVCGVGDGGNDVNMIRAAGVGIGIIGVEGRQAELASDYAVPRFRHLVPLLVVHGRYARYRSFMCVAFSFYKNIVLSFCQIYFAIHSAFSGRTIFDSWLLAVKNTIFTGAPPLFMGCFEKDLHEDLLLCPRHGPGLYRSLRIYKLYANKYWAALWLASAVVHGLLLFWLWMPMMEADLLDRRGGKQGGIHSHGLIMMSTVVTVVVAKAALSLRHVTSIQLGGILFSYLFYAGFIALYASIDKLCLGSDSSGEATCETHFAGRTWELFHGPQFPLWAVWTGVGLPAITDFACVAYQRLFHPTVRDLSQERAVDGPSDGPPAVDVALQRGAGGDCGWEYSNELVVTRVSDGPARAAGVQLRWRIAAVDGAPVFTAAQCKAALAAAPPGCTVALTPPLRRCTCGTDPDPARRTAWPSKAWKLRPVCCCTRWRPSDEEEEEDTADAGDASPYGSGSPYGAGDASQRSAPAAAPFAVAESGARPAPVYGRRSTDPAADVTVKAAAPLRAGEAVEGKFDGQWWPAEVLVALPGGICDLKWADGTMTSGVPPHEVRRFSVAAKE